MSRDLDGFTRALWFWAGFMVGCYCTFLGLAFMYGGGL